MGLKKTENLEKAEKSEFFQYVVHRQEKKFLRRLDNLAHALLLEYSRISTCAK